MARYIAVRNLPPDDGTGVTVAFAAGHQVPADQVEANGWLEAGHVVEVDDDHVGDDLTLVEEPPDTTPPTITPAQRLLNEDFDDDPRGSAVDWVPAPPDGDLFADEDQPATGDTNPTDQPVTEE